MLIRIVYRLTLSLVLVSGAAANTVQGSIYDFYPMGDAEHLDSDQPGMFYEMLNAVMEASGLDYEINVEPIARIFERIRQGKSDVLIGLPTPKARLAVPIHCNNVVIVANDDRIKTISDLEGARIGFVTGGLFDRLYGKSFGTENEYSSSDTGLFYMLNAGRIDGFMITKNVVNAYRFAPPPDVRLPANWDDKLRYVLTIKVNQVYLQYPSGSQLDEDQINRLNSSAYDLIEKGVFKTIMAKYGTEQVRNCPGS